MDVSATERYRQDLRWFLLIFALAFMIRLAFVIWTNPDPDTGQMNDSWFYHQTARDLADGRRYIVPEVGAPTVYWPPGYSGFLAAVYVLPGPDLFAGKLLNVFLGAVGCSLLFVIGRMMWGGAIGVAAGLLLTFFPSLIFYSTLVVTEIAYASLLSGVVLFFAWALKYGRASNGIVPFLPGPVLGAASLVRGEGALLPLEFGVI